VTALERLWHNPFADVEQVNASRNVVVTCEELVSPAELRDYPEHNQIAFRQHEIKKFVSFI